MERLWTIWNTGVYTHRFGADSYKALLSFQNGHCMKKKVIVFYSTTSIQYYYIEKTWESIFPLYDSMSIKEAYSTLTSCINKWNMAHGHSMAAESNVDRAWSLFAPPTSTDSFLEVFLYATFVNNSTTSSIIPPWKKERKMLVLNVIMIASIFRKLKNPCRS